MLSTLKEPMLLLGLTEGPSRLRWNQYLMYTIMGLWRGYRRRAYLEIGNVYFNVSDYLLNLLSFRKMQLGWELIQF
jgi:hypothetical protein